LKIEKGLELTLVERYFNFHNILTLKVVDENGGFKKRFNRVHNEYKYFECEMIDDPDFIVYFRKKSLKLLASQKYYFADQHVIKNDYLYCNDSHKRAKWELEIEGFNKVEQIVVNIYNNVFGSMFVTSYIIDRVLFLKACSKGYSFIHACAVSKNNQAYLFAARSGAGKTTASLHFIERGFKFLGDDYVILNKGDVLCFPTPLNMFRYNVIPSVQRKVNTKTKVILFLTRLAYVTSLGYAKILTPLNIENLFSKDVIIDRSRLSGVFVVAPNNKTSEVHVTSISENELIGHLMSNEKLDSFPFSTYMLEYSYVFPNSKIATYWNTYEENLRKNLRGNIPIYKIETPQKVDSKVFEEIFRAIQHK